MNAVVSVSAVCHQVDQGDHVVPAHQVDDIDEVHELDPVHQVDHKDEFHSRRCAHSAGPGVKATVISTGQAVRKLMIHVRLSLIHI